MFVNIDLDGEVGRFRQDLTRRKLNYDVARLIDLLSEESFLIIVDVLSDCGEGVIANDAIIRAYVGYHILFDMKRYI